MSAVAIIFIGYGVVALCAIRPIAGALAWRMHRIAAQERYRAASGEPTGEQWFGAIAATVAVVIFWPAVAVFLVQGRSDHWTVGAERLARIEERERRVREMEDRLGLERTR